MDLQAIMDASSSSSSASFTYKYQPTNDFANNKAETEVDKFYDGMSDISPQDDATYGSFGLQSSSFKESYRYNTRSESYDDDDGISFTRSQARINASRGNTNLELERILREMENNDDEDMDEDVDSKKERGNYPKSSSRESDILQSILNEDDDDEISGDENDVSFMEEYSKRRGATNGDASYFSNRDSSNGDAHNLSLADTSIFFAQPTIPLSHSMEVDAILDSVRDDGDSDGDLDLHNSSYLKYHTRMLSNGTIEDGVTDDEEEESVCVGLNFNFSNTIPKGGTGAFENNMLSAQYPLDRGVSTQNKSLLMEREQSLKDYTASFLNRHKKQTNEEKGRIANQTGDITDNTLSESISEDEQNDKISDLCLRQAELHEHRLLKPNTRNLVSPLTVKRRMKPKVTLMSKSRMSAPSTLSSQAAAPQSQPQPRFGFSGGIIQTKSMADLGTHIIKSNAQQTSLKHRNDTNGGFPTALAVNSKFIAVGTQRGTVWIFDLFEQLKMTLGAEESMTGIGNNKTVSSVTSIDLPIHGDYLLAGYGSGAICLWDVIKGIVLKGIYDLHSCPITSVRLTSFPLAYSGGKDTDIGAVSVDASGLVNKIVYSKGMLWSSYSSETECLLDGTAGQILAMDTLPPLDVQYSDGGNDYHPSAYKIVLIALSSDRSSFAVSVVPKVSVLHRWARPAAERIDPSATTATIDDNASEVPSMYASTYASSYATSSPPESNVPSQPEKLPFLPCLCWGWGLVSGGKHSVTPILARSWGCCIQFLCANFPPRDESDTDQNDGTIHWPAFGLHDEFDASSPVVALNWLGTRSLVYLTVTNEFTIIDTVIMTIQERLDFSGIKLVYAEFALSRPKRPESNLCTTFMNSIRSNDNRLLVLCQEEVKQITVLGIRQQISSLEDGGQWLECLALALDHYESTVQSQEDRQRDAHLKQIMALAHNYMLTEDEIWMSELLMRYLLLAIDNAPEQEMSSGNKRLNLAQSHFEMLSGVCLEYCVTMKRTDLLFGPIFRCFYEARYINVFLDVMETYILNDRLRYIAPEAMVLFVAHCKDMKNISIVEQCLLHLDCKLMDFDSILTLLKKNELFTGLLHVYSMGLDDYSSPLDVVFDAIFDALNSSNCIHGSRRKEGILSNKVEQYGYKVLLFIKYCFSGKTFPKGNQILPDERVHTLRSEIFEMLFRETVLPQQAHIVPPPRLYGIRSSSYPYLRSLILIDAKSLLDCLAIVLDDPASSFDETANIDIVGSWDVEYGTDVRSGIGLSTSSEKDPKLPDRQHMVNVLSSLFMTDNLVSFDNHFGVREPAQVTERAKNTFLDFLGRYLQLGVFTAPRYLTAEVMTRLCSKKGTSEDEVLTLLKALPRSSYELDEILYTIERTQMTRAALFLHQSGVSRTIDRPSLFDKCQYYFNRSIDCFLKDKEHDFSRGVFEFTRKECLGGRSLAPDDNSRDELATTSSQLRRVLLGRLSELVQLDAIRSAQLVGELFIENIDVVLSSFQGIDYERVQYSFLHAIISELPKVDTVTAQELGANMTMDHHNLYLSLMTRFQPDMVYSYLSTNKNYRLEDALQLCQDRRITDASAYLLERMGDVSGALKLMLQTLDSRMIGLKNILQESMSGNVHRSRMNNVSAIKATTINNNKVAAKELAGAKQTLVAVLDLCERNKNDHLALDNERGPLIWFHVLDRLVQAKHLLGASKTATEFHSAAISTVLSELLLMTMQRMTHHVSHYDLMHKITKDHAGNDLGEFREMLVSMLKTYSSELVVCSNAVGIMHYDIRRLSVQRKNLKVSNTCKLMCFVEELLCSNIGSTRRFEVTLSMITPKPYTRMQWWKFNHLEAFELLTIVGLLTITIPYNIATQHHHCEGSGKTLSYRRADFAAGQGNIKEGNRAKHSTL